MWRVSPDGKVTLIRDYWEDVLAQRNGTSAGTWISPNWMVRSLAEIVRHRAHAQCALMLFRQRRVGAALLYEVDYAAPRRAYSGWRAFCLKDPAATGTGPKV